MNAEECLLDALGGWHTTLLILYKNGVRQYKKGVPSEDTFFIK